MFSNLTKLEISRTGKEALGFYISYLLLTVALGFAFGAISGILNPEIAQEAGLRAGIIIAVIMCCFLSISISLKKGLFSSFKTIVIITATVLLSLLLGALGGLIPVAYLTTSPNESA